MATWLNYGRANARKGSFRCARHPACIMWLCAASKRVTFLSGLFVGRLGGLSQRLQTAVYAWALMTNHADILLRSGPHGISAFIRRFLTGVPAGTGICLRIVTNSSFLVGVQYRPGNYFSVLLNRALLSADNPTLVGGGLVQSEGGGLNVQ